MLKRYEVLKRAKSKTINESSKQVELQQKDKGTPVRHKTCKSKSTKDLDKEHHEKALRRTEAKQSIRGRSLKWKILLFLSNNKSKRKALTAKGHKRLDFGAKNGLISN